MSLEAQAVDTVEDCPCPQSYHMADTEPEYFETEEVAEYDNGNVSGLPSALPSL